MKVLYLFILLCVLGVYAQRRTANLDATNLEASSQRPVSRSRGRTRFSVTPEFEQANAEYEEVTKHTRKTDVPRRKSDTANPTEKRLPRPAKEPGAKSRPYEVKELVDDVPREDSRRVNKKPRVITETRFEAANAAKKDLFTPASLVAEELPSNLSPLDTPAAPENIAEEIALPAQLTTIPIHAISSTEKITEESLKNPESLDVSSSSEIPKIEPKLKRKQPVTTASVAKPSESRSVPHGRASLRTRGTTTRRDEEQTTPGTRIRTRTKTSRKPEASSPVVSSTPSTRPNFRPGRKRAEAVAESIQEPVKTRGPSVFAESSQELSPRSRTGRKVSSASERRSEQRNRSAENRKTGRSRGERINDTLNQTTTSEPEKIDLNLKRPGDTRRVGKVTESSTEESANTEIIEDTLPQITSSTSERVDLNLNRRIDTRRGGRFTDPSTERSADTLSSKNVVTQTTSNAPEKVNLNLSQRVDTKRGRPTEPTTAGSATSQNRNKVKNVNEPETRSQRRGATRITTQKYIDSTTQRNERQSRGRGRSRSFLTLNEQKLEVLPLFENEPKIVSQNYDSIKAPSRSSLGRRRSLNSAEDISTASTKQAEVKLEVDPINEETAETATESNIRISRQESISVETEKTIRKVYKKRPTFQRSKQPRKLHRALAESKEETTEAIFIRKFRPLNSRKNKVEDSSKEEVVNDENEENLNKAKEKPANKPKEKIAKETKEIINENEDTKQTVKVDKPKLSIRPIVRKGLPKLPSTKGKEKVSIELTTSQEAIAEGDNYPAPYKAAIQAKKGKNEVLESRSTQSNELSVTKTTETSVTSSTASTSLDSSASSETPAAEITANEDEEIDHKSESESTTIAPSTKFPRPRFSLTTKLPRSTENPSESTNKNGSNRPVLPTRKYKSLKPKPAVTTTTTQSSTEDENEASLTTTPTSLQKFHARFKSSRSQKDKGSEVHVIPRPAHKSRSYSPKAPKGLYSSRKLSKTTISPEVSEETEKPQPPKFSVETSALPTKVPPIGHSIKKSSRFSARYRSDLLSRSAAHRSSTAGPSYIPTVPTVTPPPTSVKVEENELGMEIISFDDPVANTVPSDNLISGDYLSSPPSTKTDPSVESKGAAAQTTEKPVSIIERIINSITSISTTTSPDSSTKTSTTTSGQPTKSSAILNLVSKKPKDKTVTIDHPLESGAQKLTNSPNSVEYRTTEKPTTIIEKILSSLSAIRADTAPETTTVDPLQVGSNYNTVDTTVKISSTESTSRIAKATIPMSKISSAAALPLISESTTALSSNTASSFSTSSSTVLDSDTSSTVLSINEISTIPLGTSSITPRSISTTTPFSEQATSTTLDPTNGFEQIVSDQILPKRTIDKLLSLLNIVSPTTTTSQPTTTKLVVVTPKLTTFVTSNTEPINTEQNATPIPTTLPTTSDSTSAIASNSLEITTPTLFTSTLGSSSESFSDDINLIVNPLSSAEPTVGSRILETISTLSRIMASTLSPSTTISPTSAFTSEGVSTVNLPSTTPVVSSTAVDNIGTSTTIENFESITSETPGTLTSKTSPTTTVTVTTFAAPGTSTPTTAPTSTVASVDVTAPAEAVTTFTAAANPLAISITTPLLTVTDSTTVSTTVQTNSPTSFAVTTQTTPISFPDISSSTENPSTTSNIANISTVAFPTTTQGTTSTEVSVVQGSESSVPSSTLNLITSTVTSNTQTSSTLLTTVSTTPMVTSTTGSAVTMSTTRPQTEATSASTGTTGSSIITSTTKFTRETTTDSTLDVPTTLPTLANFEVSPDRVSIYSANDISSTFVPDDPVSTTVSISARAFVPGTTLSTATETSTSSPVSTTQNVMPTSQPTVGTTGVSSTVVTTTLPNNIGSTSTAIPPAPTINSISSSMATADPLANNIISSSTITPNTSPPAITTTNSVKSANNAVDSTTQDVSSNTIDTSSVTDKQSLVNQTDVSNLVNPLSAGTNVSVADNSSMSAGLFVSPSLPDNSTFTTNTRIAMMEFMTRDGKLLRFEPNALQNSIQNNPRNKDYFIFAVLPNNTILRKRPSMYPTKETPFLIYGVLPNNTLIQKFPNGTIVPMEPVIQVIGFDTRENPPSPPEIISNQVTPDQESRPDNNKISTGDVAQNTVSSIEANQLSINSASSTTANTLPTLTEILGGRTVTAFNSIVNQTQGEGQTAKVQTLQVDPLIESRVNVENVEINTISSASSSPPPPPTPAPSSSTAKAVTTTSSPSPPTTQPPGPPSTEAPFTTPLPLTTAVPVVSTQVSITSPKITTGSPTTAILLSTNPPGLPVTEPTIQTTLPQVTSTTARVPTTTFVSTFLTTLLSTLQPQTSTTIISPTTTSTTISPALTTVSSIPVEVSTTLAPVTTTLRVPFTSPLPRAPVASPNPLSIPDIEIGDSPKAISSTTVPSPSLMDLLSNGAKISSTPFPTTLSSTVSSLKDINLKQKQLTEQQKKDLETLEALEKEQEAILQQLAFLTGLNVGAVSPPKKKDNLADRVIAMAVDRVKDADSSSSNSPPALNLLEILSPKDSRQSKSIAAAPSVEELVKQISANGLNSVTPAGPIVTSTYGKTNDALLASLLKEYGVGPSTPKVLSGAYDKEVRSTTIAPKASTTKISVTTQAPGRIMQGLNWLLNALAPVPPPKPVQSKSKPKPKPLNNDELLSKQPTEITPVVVESPHQPGEESKTENNVISQNQLQALVKQLEEIQKDPKKAKDLDIEALKALQNIELNQKSGIQVIAASSTGASSRATSAPKISSTKSAERSAKYTTPLPLSVSNNIVEDIGPTTGAKSTIPPVVLKDVPGVAADIEAATTKTKIPPVKLNPVPGVPDENPRIRGQLVNYAINVTKAISTFLGSAIQGAANSFQSIIGSGSRTSGNYRNSDSSNRPG